MTTALTVIPEYDRVRGHHKPKWPKCACDNCLESTWAVVEGCNADPTKMADWQYAYGPCSVRQAVAWVKQAQRTNKFAHVRIELVVKSRFGYGLRGR
jgi:hypothetical protein